MEAGKHAHFVKPGRSKERRFTPDPNTGDLFASSPEPVKPSISPQSSAPRPLQLYRAVTRLDDLASRLHTFEAQKPTTIVEVKEEVLSMLTELGRLAPRSLYKQGADKLVGLVSSLIETQNHLRFEKNTTKAAELAARNEQLLDEMGRIIHRSREAILPRRKGADPHNPEALFALNHTAFFDFAKKLLHRFEQDHKQHPDALQAMQSVSAMEPMLQQIVTLNELAMQARNIAKDYQFKPQQFTAHLSELRHTMSRQIAAFKQATPPTIMSERTRDQLQQILQAESPSELEKAANALRYFPTKYVRGILEDLDQAYVADCGRAPTHPFTNVSAVAKGMYAVRWALLADPLAEMVVSRFRPTLRNSEYAIALTPPSHTDQVQRAAQSQASGAYHGRF